MKLKLLTKVFLIKIKFFNYSVYCVSWGWTSREVIQLVNKQLPKKQYKKKIRKLKKISRKFLILSLRCSCSDVAKLKERIHLIHEKYGTYDNLHYEHMITQKHKSRQTKSGKKKYTYKINK